MLTVKEVAEKFEKNQKTIQRWLAKELLPGAFQDDKGTWQIPVESVENIPKVDKIDAPIIEAATTLVGKRFNDLTVTEITGYKPEGKQNKIHVIVVCECGNEVEKPLYVVKDGRVKRCGHECFLTANVEIGARFGFLTVIGKGELKEAGKRSDGRPYSRRFVETRCDCGNEKLLNLSKLKTGEQNSCGKDCVKWREK